MIYWIFSLLLIFIFNCEDYNKTQNSNDKYYTLQETNSRIAIAFAIKDSQCSYSHKLTSFIPGSGKKTQVNFCIQAILTRSCTDWNVPDPTPILCRTINFKFGFKSKSQR